MKNNNFTKKPILAALLVAPLLFFAQKSHAQMAVIDPAAIAQFASHITLQSAWEVAREAYARTIAAASTSAITASTDSVRATQNIQIKQAEFNQKDTDQRYRKAMGDQYVAQRDLQATPTIERCVELTAALGRQAGSSATRSGGGRVAASVENRLKSVNSFGGAAAASIAGRQELSTCTKDQVANKVTQCTSVGRYPDGDHKISSLFVNRDTSKSKGTVSINGAAAEVVPAANYSFDTKGQEVAERLIGNIVAAKPPLMLTPEQQKKAPGYMALYYAVTTRIDSATDALRNIVAWKYEPSAKVANSEGYKGFKNYWKKQQSTYEEMFPEFTFPSNPSEYEMLHFEIMKNYGDVMGKKSEDSVMDGNETDKKILEQAIVNNYLSLLKIKQGEDTNSLLATMLANQISPIPAEQLEAERLKAQSAPK